MGEENADKEKVVFDEKYQEDSDDDMPEVVSNSAMKSNFDTLNKEVAEFKQNLLQQEKTKRKERQEKNEAQKKRKMSKLIAQPEFDDNDADGVKVKSSINLDTKEIPSVDSKPIRPARKVYPSLNIVVEPLENINDTRASLAQDFKTRRLNKVHRESVRSSVISYQKKLLAKK